MKRAFIEAYCEEVVGTKQEILSFKEYNGIILIVFEYNEDYIYQEDIEITIFDLISFVYSKL